MYIMPTREYITFRIIRSFWFIESVHLLFPFSHSASHNVCSLFQISVIKYNVASIVSTSENLGDCSMHFGMGFRSNTNKRILWHFPGELRCSWGPHNACQPRLMTYVLHYFHPDPHISTMLFSTWKIQANTMAGCAVIIKSSAITIMTVTKKWNHETSLSAVYCSMLFRCLSNWCFWHWILCQVSYINKKYYIL